MATTELSTLSLHDALPIFGLQRRDIGEEVAAARIFPVGEQPAGEAVRRLLGQPGGDRHRFIMMRRIEVPAHDPQGDRKSTRLNSSHLGISYAVFCLKKKNE